jgi:uncharacterized protein (DUF952 family)/ribosome-associated protein YbcJ (S4-like RNA binding protein)
MTTTLFHIVGQGDWARAVAAGTYRPESLAREGFIHLSTRAQLAGTAAKWFAGRDDLLVLCLEDLPGDVRVDGGFPHLYGPLALDSVTEVRALHVRSDGEVDLLARADRFIRLDHVLKRAGLVDNGGHAKAVIQGGEVLVDGVVETRRGRKLRGGERVSFAGREIVVDV